MDENLKVVIQTVLKAPSQADLKRIADKMQKTFNTATKPLNTKDIDTYIQHWNNSVSRMQIGKAKLFARPEVKKDLEDLMNTMSRFKEGSAKISDVNLKMDNLRTTVAKVSSAYKNVNKDGYAFGQMLTIAAKKIAIWFAATTGVYAVIHKIEEGIKFIVDLDKNMTNIRIVTGKTAAEMDVMAKSYNNMAKEMGATTNELMTGATEWFRQGKTTAEAQELVKASIIESKLAAIDSAQATEYLTAILNGFKLESKDVIGVIDSMVAVDNVSATSVAELSDALQRSSNSAQQAGVDFNRLLGYIGTVSSVTRKSASSIGESFKTMFARMQDIKAGNLDEDNMAISDVEKALNRQNIALRSSEDTFRDMQDVLDDVASKWKNMSDVEQSEVAKAIAGVRQRENFLVLMNNYSQALELEKTAANSAGLALDRYRIYMESAEAAQNRLTATWEAFWLNTVKSGWVTDFLNGLSNVVAGIDHLINETKALDFALNVGAFLGAVKLTQVFGEMVLAINVARTATGSLAVSMGILKAISGPLAVALGLVVAGIIAYSTKTAEAKAKQDELNNAFSSFETTLNQFNTSMDTSKITELKSQLDALMSTVDYYNKKKSLDELKKQWDSATTLQKRSLLPQIRALEAELSGVEEAQRKYNQAVKDSKEPYTIQNGLIVANISVLQQMANAKKEDLAITINTARQALIAENQYLAGILKNAGMEIESIKTVAQAKAAARKATGELGVGFGWEAKAAIEADMESRLTSLVSYQDTINNLITGGVGGGVITGGGGTTGATATAIDYEDMSAELIRSYNAEVEIDKLEAKLLEKKIKLAEKQEDYNKKIELTNQLIENQRKTVVDLDKANAQILSKEDEIIARAKTYGFDATKWFDVNGEATVQYMKDINGFAGKTDQKSKDTQSTLKDMFKSLYDLKKAFGDNTNEIDEMNLSILDNIASIEEFAQKSLEKTLKPVIDDITDEIDAMNKATDAAVDRLEAKIKSVEDSYDARIAKAQKELDILNEQYETEDRMLALREIEDEMSKVLADKRYERITVEGALEYTYDEEKYNDLVKQREELLREYQRQDVLDAKQAEIDGLEEAKDREVEILQTEIDNIKLANATKVEEYTNFKETLNELQNSELADLTANVDAKIAELQKYQDAWKEYQKTILAAQSAISTSMGSSTSAPKASSSSGANTFLQNLANGYDQYGNKANAGDVIWAKAELAKTETHHSGINSGLVGGISPTNSEEVMIKALKGELIINKSQIPQIVPNILKSFAPILPKISGIGGTTNTTSQNYTIKVDKIITDSPADFFKQINHLVVAKTGGGN